MGHVSAPFAGFFSKPSDGLEPSTPSLPWRFRGGNRVHARSLAATFVLQIRRWQCVASARTCPLVLSLLYPSRTRGVLSVRTTNNGGVDAGLSQPGRLVDDPAHSRSRPRYDRRVIEWAVILASRTAGRPPDCLRARTQALPRGRNRQPRHQSRSSYASCPDEVSRPKKRLSENRRSTRPY